MAQQPRLSPVAARVQSSVDRLIPFVTSNEGDVYLLPVTDEMPLPHLQRGLAELVSHGFLRRFQVTESGGTPVALAVTAKVA